MQTIKVTVEDNLLDKILWLLNSFKGVKVESENSQFFKEIEESEKDILNGRVEKIEDVDKYIEELKNELS
jgi:ectoine hydroxylase-related dioxygenase (phytanoyl-CoA dioxygenase family)